MKLPTKLKKHGPFLILVSILCWIVFMSSLDGQFVSDDIQGIVRNPINRNFNAVFQYNNFSIQRLIYAVSLKLFGLNPVPMHILALILHNINVILAFFLAKKLTNNKKVGYITSTLFAVHPLVTEPVNWISGMHYLYITGILITIILLYIHFREEGKKADIISAAFIFLFAVLFIKNAWLLVLPFLIFTLEIFYIRKGNLKTKILFPLIFFGIAAFYTGVYYSEKIESRVEMMETTTTSNQDTPSYLTRISYTVASATKLLIFPKDLTLYHEGEEINLSFLLLGQLVLLGSIGLFIYALLQKKYSLAGIVLAYYITLLPTFSPVQVSWFIADRYLYFTVLIFALSLGIGINKIREKKSETLAIIILSTLLVTYSIKDIIRSKDWSNRKNLWEATAKTSPNSPRVYNNLGDVYALENNYDKSIENFKRAIELNHNYAEAHHNLARTYMEIERFEDAEKYFKQSVKINPGIYQSYFNLGYLRYLDKEYEEAKTYLETSLKINPSYQEAKTLLEEVNLKLSES